MTDEIAYEGRPGPSPVFAALLAAQVIRPGVRVLDLACGNGVDSLLLARSGAGYVRGFDEDASLIAEANRAARRYRVHRVARYERRKLPAHLASVAEASFDIVIDTMGSANLPRPTRVAGLVARVLVDGGRWILHERHDHDRRVAAATLFPPRAERYFHLSRALPTHLAEYRREDHGDFDRPVGRVPAIASVYVAIATRRNRSDPSRRGPRSRGA